MLNGGKPKLDGAVLDQAAFEAIAAAHERFLRGAGGVRAGLRFADARGLDGRRRLLNDADFTGSDLRGSLLAGSHFERAALYCADLGGCDLRSANLHRADLRGARLAGASLNGAVLDEADMRAAYILRARPGGDLKREAAGPRAANDNHAADFSNCAMRGVRLRNANLKGANFTGAILDGADFAGAKLTGAVFEDAVLTSVQLDGAPLSPEQLKGCILDPGAEAITRARALAGMLRQAAEWVETCGKAGQRAVLDGEDLRPLGAALRARALTALSARAVRAIRMDFSRSALQGAVFDDADLRGAVFDGADLRGATFRGAKLSHASFTGADLGPLPLPNGRLFFPDFTGAAMERTDFSRTVLEGDGTAAPMAVRV